MTGKCDRVIANPWAEGHQYAINSTGVEPPTGVTTNPWAEGHQYAINSTATEIMLNAQQNTLLANLAGALERDFGDKTQEEYYEFLKQSLIKELFK